MVMLAALLMPAALAAQQPEANPIAQSFRGFGYFGSWSDVVANCSRRIGVGQIPHIDAHAHGMA